jgi:ATP/maltotriose-dependent transcriptional regulator MalT
MSTNGSPQTDARHWLVIDDARTVAEDLLAGGVRYHQLLAGLLELELRRTESAGVITGRRTAHAELIAELVSLLAEKESDPALVAPAQLREPLTESEIRVLRYLPTNLRAPEIASDLCLSVNTIRTHVRHVYEKLAAHSRIEAVERARALGLLAPSSRWP